MFHKRSAEVRKKREQLEDLKQKIGFTSVGAADARKMLLVDEAMALRKEVGMLRSQVLRTKRAIALFKKRHGIEEGQQDVVPASAIQEQAGKDEKYQQRSVHGELRHITLS